MEFLLGLNWLVVGQIILIDILLGGDNAILIALACRDLPPHLRTKGILWGTFGAIALRIVFIAFAVTVLEAPYVKFLGGLLLLWIGVKLLADNNKDHAKVASSDRLLSAIKTIIVADMVMSIDNVVAIASAAEQAGGEHRLALVVFGIVASIPIIVWGSTLVLKLMERLPLIITLGAAFLGYVAGAMLVADAALAPWFNSHVPLREVVIPGLGIGFSMAGAVGAIAVVVIGRVLARKKEQ